MAIPRDPKSNRCNRNDWGAMISSVYLRRNERDSRTWDVFMCYPREHTRMEFDNDSETEALESVGIHKCNIIDF